MLDRIKTLLGRLRIRMSSLVTALVAALPVLLDQLGVIDLKPLLTHFMSPESASALIGLMPFILAFLKPLVHFETEECEHHHHD